MPALICAVLEDISGLPIIPDDGSGRHTSWLFVTGSPGFKYQGQWYVVDDVFADFQMKEFDRLTQDGYEPPVILKHDSLNTKERRLADIIMLCKREYKGAVELACAVRWCIEDAEKAIELGQIRYFSPGFNPLENSQGGPDFPFVLSEMSQVAAPHQKGRGTHILAGENIMPIKLGERGNAVSAAIDAKVSEEASREEIIAAVSAPAEIDAAQLASFLDGSVEPSLEEANALLKALDAEPIVEGEENSAVLTPQAMTKAIIQITEMLKSLLPKEKDEIPPAKEPVQLAEKTSQFDALTKQINDLQSELDHKLFMETYPLGGSLEMTEKVGAILFKAWRSDKAAFDAVMSKSVTLAETPSKTVAATRPSPWGGVALGESGSSSAPAGAMSTSQKVAQCKVECNGDMTAAMKLYESRYIHV